MKSLVVVLALSACSVPADIVASVGDSSDEGDSPDEEAPTPRLDAGCSTDLWLWSESGELARIPDDKVAPITVARPDCLASGVMAAAVDQSGSIWAHARDGSSWLLSLDGFACTRLEWEHRPSALAFAYTPDERLFAVEEGRLLEIDVGTYEARTFTTIDKGARLLKEATLGLLALTMRDDGVLELDAIDTVTGGVKPQRTLIAAEALRGATYWRGELMVLLGSQLARYRDDDTAPQIVSELAAGYDGLFAHRCAK